jgi:hypothetical protein
MNLLVHFFILIATLFYASAGIAQEIRSFRGQAPESVMASAVTATFLSDRLAFSEFKLTPVVKSGYRRMGMNVMVPVPFEVTVQGAQSYKGETVRLRLPDANLWILEAGLEIKIPPSLKLTLSGTSNIFQNLATRIGGYVDSETETRLRKGHPLDWLETDVSIAYAFYDPFAAVTGLRWDRFDLEIKDPAALANMNVGPYPNVGLFASEVLSNLWIPYMGAEFSKKKVKARIVGSMLGWANVKVTTRIKGDLPPSQKFTAQSVVTMFNAPYFVEASAEYEVTLAEKTNINFWGKGGWLGASGGGRLESAFSPSNPNLNLRVLDDRNVAYGRYSLAGGIALKMAF